MAQFRAEDVTRHVNQTREQLTEAVFTDKQTYFAALADIHDGNRSFCQLVQTDLEQVIARIHFQNLNQLLAVVAVWIKTRRLQNRLNLLTQNRHIARCFVVDRSRVQAQEAALTNHIAFIIKTLDTNVIRVCRTMNTSVFRGFGKGQQLRNQNKLTAIQRQLVTVLGVVARVIQFQDTQLRSRHQFQYFLAIFIGNFVLVITQESEVFVIQPLQEINRFIDIIISQMSRTACR